MFSAFTQTIDRIFYQPTTNWQHFFNPQMVFNLNPQDEAVEGHVLSRVGSYGSQIDKLIDAIDVLKSQIDDKKLDEAAQAKLKAFDALRDAAASAVSEFRAKLSASDLLAGAQALRQRDPAAAASLAALLQNALVGKTAEPEPATSEDLRAKIRALSTDSPASRSATT
jgi:hypothetical protein